MANLWDTIANLKLPIPEPSEGADDQHKEAPSGPKMLRYNPGYDISVLKEVLLLNPFDDASRWDEIAKAFNKELMKRRPNVQAVNSRSIKERVEKLLKAFKSEQMAALRRSGTAEEYTERDSLLTEISQMKDESHVKKASETKGSDDKDIIKQGEAVRKHAMEGMAKKDDSTPSKKVRRTQSMSEYVEYKKAEIELRKVRKQELQMEREEKGRMFSMMKTMLESMKK
ncbi:uncharacterized protein LOC135487233 [Lineus longissimus]|uniref:uncharacterized protein LOC135487233 n=1 Tax=Lineus longissimus TaxID=88925 RepID=UPI002B4F5612